MKIIYPWILIFFNAFVVSSPIKDLTDTEKDHDLNACISGILKSLIKPHDLILSFNFLLNEIPHIHFSRIGKLLTPVDKRFDIYVIRITNQTKFTSILIELEHMQKFNPSAKYNVIVDILQNAYFKLLEKYFIWDVVFIKVINDTYQELYLNEAYQYENVHNVYVNPTKVGNCYKNILTTNKHIYDKHLPKYWRNTTLRVLYMSRVPYVIERGQSVPGGFEVTILKELKDRLKVKMFFLKQDTRIGNIRVDGNYMSGFKTLKDRKGDVLVGSIISPQDFLLNDFDLSAFYVEDTLVWMLPTAQKLPNWQVLFQSFSVLIWIYLSVSFCCVTILLVFIEKFNIKTNNNMVSIIALSVLLEQDVNYPRQTRSYSLYITLVSWMYFSLIINMSFKSKLLYALTGDIYGEQIDSLGNAVEAGLDFGMEPYAVQVLDVTDPVERYIFDNHIDCDFTTTCMNMSASTGHLVFLGPKRFAKYMIPKRFINSDIPLIHIIERPGYKAIQGHMFFVKGLPLLYKLDELLLRFFEAGLFDKVLREYSYEFLQFKDNLNRAKYDMRSKSLNIHDILPAFWLLLTGALVGLLMLVMELCIHK